MENMDLQSRTKVGRVVAFLRRAILTGDIVPGEWLRQDELAEEFGVSPTPVREAFRHLEAEGLVEHIPHRGVRAVVYDIHIARDYYELRALLEPYAVQRAAKQLENEDITQLEALLDAAQEQLQNNDLAKLTEVNWQFHKHLVGLCGSRLVQDTLSFVTRSFQLDTLLFLPERAIASYEEHRAIFAALQEGNGVAAAEAMRQNIENAREAMLARLPALGKVKAQLDTTTFS